MSLDQLMGANADVAAIAKPGKKRIEWVDITKCICIVFVILSHLENSQIAPGLFLFYNDFYLTGFLFVSGYVYRFVPGFWRHIKKKIRQLFIPWLVFGVANIALSYIFTFSPDKHLDFRTELARNFLQVRGYNDRMWFVAALFTSYLFMYFFVKSFEVSKTRNGKNAVRVYALIAAALFFVNKTYVALMPKEIFPWETNSLPWHFEYVPYALCFMFAGYLFRQYFEGRFDAFFSNGRTVIVIVLYLLMVYSPYIFAFTMPWYIQNLYSFAETGLAVIMLVLISKKIKPNKYLLFVGQNTLAYFGMHGKVLALFEAVFTKISPSVYSFVAYTPVVSSVYSIFAGVLLSVLLIIPTMIVNRYFPFAVGKPYRQRQKKQE